MAMKALLLLLVVSPLPSAFAYWFAAAPPTIPSNVKVLILPGFGNESADYLLEQVPKGSLVNSLVSRGWNKEQIRVLPLQRLDWLSVFLRGALDPQFWLNAAPPTRPAFRWYLDLVAAEIEQLTAADTSEKGDSPCNKVVLVCHSAGGWLGRAFLGYVCADLEKICGIVTLGAPHLPPPPEIMDMTRGALRLTHENFPGAYHVDQLFYITVSGDAIKGVKQLRTSPLESTSVTGFAFNSYEAVCGDGEAMGDGVVPQCAAHLEGATQIDLPGIFHSINVPDRWYGSDTVIDSWHSEMLRQIAARQGNGNKATLFSITNPLEGIFR